jgi:hypothetical protein
MRITLIGAGGKMGLRLARNLIPSGHILSCTEVSDAGKERLGQMGVKVSETDRAVPDSDAVILAVPDRILGKISCEVVPLMKRGAMLITLDPACALAGKICHRDDLSYFITHPSHPSVFNWEPTEEAQHDYFGGTLAKQAIVCALFHGPEKDYAMGEELARLIYAPVRKAYRITAEQMGLLEPALVETLCSTLQVIVKEGLDIVISKGVPAEAAREFLLGHLNIQLAVIYGQIPGAVFSDAANKAIERGIPLLVKEDWRQVFEPENVSAQIREITN